MLLGQDGAESRRNSLKSFKASDSVMTNFMCQFDWVKVAHIACKTFFLGVSVRVFLQRLAFESED